MMLTGCCQLPPPGKDELGYQHKNFYRGGDSDLHLIQLRPRGMFDGILFEKHGINFKQLVAIVLQTARPGRLRSAKKLK